MRTSRIRSRSRPSTVRSSISSKTYACSPIPASPTAIPSMRAISSSKICGSPKSALPTPTRPWTTPGAPRHGAATRSRAAVCPRRSSPTITLRHGRVSTVPFPKRSSRATTCSSCSSRRIPSSSAKRRMPTAWSSSSSVSSAICARTAADSTIRAGSVSTPATDSPTVPARTTIP